jgi:transcriptional antiterminator RfaH
VQTETRRELSAADYLARDGYEAYVPRLIVPVNGVRRILPLFPSYLFVRIELTNWSSIRWTIGCIRVLMNGERPAELPETIMNEIRRREGRDGVIRLETFSLRKGDRVRVTRGSFQGVEGIFQCPSPHDRVQILLTLLGQAVPVELPAAHVVAVRA